MTGPHTDSKKLPACKDRCPNRCGTGRNLVVCIDGTSNKFGPKVGDFCCSDSWLSQFCVQSTNIVELYSRLIKDEGQLTFYDSGIGTYAEPSWKSLGYVKQIVAKKADLALALYVHCSKGTLKLHSTIFSTKAIRDNSSRCLPMARWDV